MALQSARQLLDELMGRERNLRPSEKTSNPDESEWNNPDVCRFFLVQFCPNQLFTNTKADMGPCHKIHDDFIKKAYQDRASKREKALFEDEFIRFCQQTLSDVERRIKRARQRLAASQNDKNNMNDPSSEVPYLSEECQEKMKIISDKINELLLKAEELGCEGNVEEAQGIMKLVEKLKEEKSTLKRDNMPTHWIQQRAEVGAAQEKQMEVCDVCGAFLIVNDVQQRVDDHLMGKQHVGYGKLKTTLDEMLSKRELEKNEKNALNEDKNKEKREVSRIKSDREGRNGMPRYEEKQKNYHSYREDKNREKSPSSRREKRERRSERRSRSRSQDRRSSHSHRKDKEKHRSHRRRSRSPRR